MHRDTATDIVYRTVRYVSQRFVGVMPQVNNISRHRVCVDEAIIPDGKVASIGGSDDQFQRVNNDTGMTMHSYGKSTIKRDFSKCKNQ